MTYLVFLAMVVGFWLACALVPSIFKSYKRSLARAQELGQSRLPPEYRLIFAMITAPGLPISLFWMGWTAYPSFSVWSPIMATVPAGFAVIGIFITTYQYLIDTFEMYAASALVGCAFVRYVVTGVMIPVSIPWYENVGVHWTLTILGIISALLTPVPFIFWKVSRPF